MTGLILSDIYAMKKQMKLLGGMSVIYVVFGIVSENPSMISAFFVLFSAMMVVSSFSYGEQCQFDILANTLPIRRTKIVLAKYILAVGCIVTAAVMGVVAFVLSEVIHHNIQREDFYVLAVVCLIGTLFVSMALPVIFKVGSERARLILVLIYLVPFLIAWMALQYDMIDFETIFNQWYNRILWCFLALVAVVFVVSVFVSVMIYNKKEF